jgi:hypothetical protein
MDLSIRWKQIPDKSGDLHFVSVQTTKHYTFQVQLHYRYFNKKCTSVHMYIGSHGNQCFSLSLPFVMKDDYSSNENIAHLSSIKRIRDCLDVDVSDEVWNSNSLAVEIMNCILDILRFDFPHIKFITLEDDSQLECSANPLDKLDLLYYSVATTGKTWYEKNFQAYTVPRDQFVEYKCKVRDFQSQSTKEKTLFEEIQAFVFRKGTHEAFTVWKERDTEFRGIYADSKTFSEFFTGLNKILPKDQKCSLYKEWIKHFVVKYIGEIERKWVIPVYKMRQGGTRRSRQRRRRF